MQSRQGRRIIFIQANGLVKGATWKGVVSLARENANGQVLRSMIDYLRPSSEFDILGCWGVVRAQLPQDEDV